MTKTTIQWALPFSPGLLVASAAVVMVAYALLRMAAGAPIAPARKAGLWTLRGAILALIGLILLNPVRVQETPGPVERANVVYLIDSSQSMALGERGQTRWDQALEIMREADRARDPRTGPSVGGFRFGSRLEAIQAAIWQAPAAPRSPAGGPGTAVAAEPAHAAEPPPAPTDSDTLLTGSLETLTGRFGQVPPGAVVVFSDGRARDAERAAAIARAYGRMKIPIHVVPVGDGDVGGDVATVSMVVPAQVRKSTNVPVQVFLRSFGYKGRRAELKLAALGTDGRPGAVLARTPVTLTDGLSSYTLTFASGDEDRSIAAVVDPQPGEASIENNTFSADVTIDHTKIRVLYVEGSAERYVSQKGGFLGFGGTQEVVGAYSALQKALMEDPDMECTAVLPSADGDFSVLSRADERGRGLPETPSELFAYDAIILSNVPREAFSDELLGWIDEWVGRRGGGLCMVGGPNSFGAGRWTGTTVGAMLPVDLADGGDWDAPLVTIRPASGAEPHPIWHVAADASENRTLLQSLPSFVGSNRAGRVKPTAEVLARLGDGAGSPPALAVQPYGRGRTMALTTGITRRFSPEFSQSWGGADARYYKKFWRNAVYWLTENSSIGRRRLLAETDKRLYRPGETIVLKSHAFDENAAQTLDYRVAVSVEPLSAAEVASDDSPLSRPTGSEPSGESSGPLLPWGEEFDLRKTAAAKTYEASLPIARAADLPTGVTLTQGLRIELTAYEGNTQVDSTALEVQVLDDPSEQQNPLPDHDLLARMAEGSGGSVLSGPDDLAAMLARLPASEGPPEVKSMPAWSRGWLLVTLIGLLTAEWIWRRRLGLA